MSQCRGERGPRPPSAEGTVYEVWGGVEEDGWLEDRLNPVCVCMCVCVCLSVTVGTDTTVLGGIQLPACLPHPATGCTLHTVSLYTLSHSSALSLGPQPPFRLCCDWMVTWLDTGRLSLSCPAGWIQTRISLTSIFIIVFFSFFSVSFTGSFPMSSLRV